METSQIISLAGPTLTAIIAIIGVWKKMESRITDVEAQSTIKVHAVETALSDFKLKVAEEYASWETVRSIESRLTERMDNLSTQVMAMPEAVVDRITKYLALKST
jgi:uncharacterized coiled-coil protein SlyX